MLTVVVLSLFWGWLTAVDAVKPTEECVVTNDGHFMLETLKCARHRAAIEDYENLMETPEALDIMCSQQDMFYGCLEKMLRSKSGRYAELPPALMNAKLMTKELCLEGSAWRKSYLQWAHCINQQDTDFCSTSEFLSAVEASGEETQLNVMHEKFTNCVAAILTMNCDIEAGNVFHYLLKLDTPSSDCNLQDSPSYFQNSNKNASGNESSYTSLLKKIGDIPQQENIDQSYILDESDSGETLEEIVDSSVTENVEKLDTVDTVTSNHDNTEQTLSSDLKHNLSNIYNGQNELKQDNVVVHEHSGARLSIYWMQSGFIPIESVKCEHIPSDERMFHCHVERRKNDPKCLHELFQKVEITPAEIDPEFGAKLYETRSKVAYPFQELLIAGLSEQDSSHSSDSERDLKLDAIEDLNEASIQTTSVFEQQLANEDLLAHSILSQNLETSEEGKCNQDLEPTKDMLRSQRNLNSDVSDNESSNSRIETLDKLAEAFTAPTQTSNTYLHGNADIVPDYIRQELKNLFGESELSYHDGIVHTSDGSMDIYYADKGDSPIESLMCGRVNECHPKGKNIFKCAIILRIPTDVEKSTTATGDNQDFEDFENVSATDENKPIELEEYVSLDDSDLSELEENSSETPTFFYLTEDGATLKLLEPTDIASSSLDEGSDIFLEEFNLPDIYSDSFDSDPTERPQLLVLEQATEDSNLSFLDDLYQVLPIEDATNKETTADFGSTIHSDEKLRVTEAYPDLVSHHKDIDDQTVLKLEGLLDKHVDLTLESSVH